MSYILKKFGQYERDFVSEYELIIEDIVFFFHECAKVGGLCIDSRGEAVNKTYYEYLEVEGLPPSQERFVVSGCLLLILAHTLDYFLGCDEYMKPHAKEALARVRYLNTEDKHLFQLQEQTIDALLALINEKESYESDAQWAYEVFVEGYFKKCLT